MEARGILRSGLLLFVLLLLPSCGGGGGGGGGGNAPSAEIVYVLEKNATGSGQVEYFAMNPSNGSFYSGSSTLSTGGNVPVSLVADPSNDYLYVLNNNTSGTSSNGSVTSFSAASYGTSSTVISNAVSTGTNPVNMAVDPKGGYLVVADHGSGLTSGGGDVKVFPLSGGTLGTTSTWTNNSCPNPFRVVFAPGAAGTTSDGVVVVCSSPELVAAGSSSVPQIEVYSCTLGDLINNSNSCTSIYSNTSSISSAITAFAFDPSGTVAAAPQVTGSGSGSSAGGLLLICVYKNGQYNCPTGNPEGSGNSWFTTESVAFFGTGSNVEAYAGNYNPDSYDSSSSGGSFVSGTNEMASCYTSSSSSQLTSSTSCSILSMTSTSNGSSIGDPYYFFVSGNYLYIVVTETPLSGPYLTTGPTTASLPTGYLLSCYVGSTTCSVKPTGAGPVSVSTDPQTGNYLFVPSVSGTISVFSGATTGTLTPLTPIQASSGYAALSVVALTPP